MNRYPGLFRELATQIERQAFIDWADRAFADAEDELRVKAISHPLVRLRLGELLMERAQEELRATVAEEATG
jgi:hypothetical protein